MEVATDRESPMRVGSPNMKVALGRSSGLGWSVEEVSLLANNQISTMFSLALWLTVKICNTLGIFQPRKLIILNIELWILILKQDASVR